MTMTIAGYASNDDDRRIYKQQSYRYFPHHPPSAGACNPCGSPSLVLSSSLSSSSSPQSPTTTIISNIVTIIIIIINTVLPRRTLQSSDGLMVGSELHGKWKWYWFCGGESGQLDESESEQLDRRIWVQAIKWYPWPWHATQPFKRLLVKGYKLTVILSSVCMEFLLTTSWIWRHYKVGCIDDGTKKKLLTKVTNTCSTWPFSTVSDSSAPNPPVKIIAKLDKC